MKKLFIFFLVAYIPTAHAQTNAGTGLSPDEVKKTSLYYQERANWFRFTPQYNNDSTVYYFNQAVKVVKENRPVQNERLVELITDMINMDYRSYEFKEMDSLAAMGNGYFKKISDADNYTLQEYLFLAAWTKVKLEQGETKPALEIFTKALALLQDDERPGIKYLLLKDKAIFFSRSNSSQEWRLARDPLLECLTYYQSKPVKENIEVVFRLYKSLYKYYDQKGMPDSVYYYVEKVNELLPQTSNPLHPIWYYSTLGRVILSYPRHAEKPDRIGPQDLETAHDHILKAIKIIEQYKVSALSQYSFCLGILGDIAIKKQQYDEAIGYMKKARILELLINSRLNAVARLDGLSHVYEAKGEFDSALKYSRQYETEMTVYRNESFDRGLQENDLQLNLLSKEKTIAEKNAQRNLLMGFTAIALLSIGFMVFIYQRKKRDSAIIEKQSKALQQLDIAKTRFFANVSHELRTPLTLILAPLGTVLKNENINRKDEALVKIAREQSGKLLGLVNEILDLTKLEAGSMTTNEEPTELYPFARRLLSQFESYAAQKKISVVFDYDETLPQWLLLDKPKLERIFNNLLSNAIKFTESGGTVTIKQVHKAASLQLTVTDTGRGIHPGDLPHIFNRFYQTGQANTAIEGGTGIGLALANELALLMQGTLTAESVLGKGSAFTLTLPVKEVLGITSTDSEDIEDYVTENDQAETRLTVLSQPAVTGAARSTVMVVEDNHSLRSYLQLILSNQYKVIAAENGQEALHILAKGKSFLPDLIVSDIMMPVMDGFQLIEKLKAEKQWHTIPIIMLTARAEIQDRLKALRIGVDDYLLKPFEEDELFARIKNLLHNAGLRKKILAEETQIAALPAGTPEEEKPFPLIQTAEQQEWLANLEKIVRENMGNHQLSVDGLADMVYISRAQFYRKVQLLTGLTPNQYLQQIRFHHVRTMLEQGKLTSVKAAAAAIGIQKVRYFSEQFKERFGKLPSDYLA